MYWENMERVSVVAQQVELLPVMLPFHMGAGLSTSCSSSDKAAC